MADLDYRLELARGLLSANITDVDLQLTPDLTAMQPALLAAGLSIDFPTGLEPQPKPATSTPGLEAALPNADVLVVTWTVDEQTAMCEQYTLILEIRRHVELRRFVRFVGDAAANRRPGNRTHSRS
jgi:hypothetical protein